MAEVTKPSFLVDTASDPVAIRIEGRASFQNSACLNEFFNTLVAQGRLRFVMDFSHCTSMDSTFLGVLAGAALLLRKQPTQGSLVVCRLGERNLELVRNLGLHRLLIVDTGAAGVSSTALAALPALPAQGELESARQVLAAHENLVVADAANQAKFEDVLSYLKSRVQQG